MSPIGSLASMVYLASTWVLPVVFAVTFHEAAHGFIAYQFGDDTAWRAGRVTFNPLNHIDRFGTIILPAMLIIMRAPFLFGYAKPVPVNFRRLHHPRRDMVWVALAGPATNVLLMITASYAFGAVRFLPGGQDPTLHSLWWLLVQGVPAIAPSPATWVAANIVNAIVINAVLCVFNMLPLPPLDGGRVAVGLLPDVLALRLARLEPYGILIVLLLFVVSYVGRNAGFDLLGWLIGLPADAVIRFALAITGQSG